MSKTIGSASIELRATTKRLKSDLAAGEREIQAAMRRAEFAISGSADRGAGAYARTSRQMVRDIKRAEAEIIGSSAAIGKALTSATGALVGGVGVAGAVALTDSYTRFANALKVAGVEGDAFAKVSDHLFASAIKNGVGAESLATLYSRAAQSAGDLGASQSDLLKFTDGVTAALRIQGGDAASSAGALLQLSQALASGTVHAEEFASINEGARPILEAVAKGSDRFKGSVTALRAAVYDGTVTSQEFFAGFLRGSSDLETRAAKAPLTIAASLQSLQTALVKYIGEADRGAGASAALTFAIQKLGENIPLISNALAVVAVILAGRYAAAVGLATVAGALQTAELITRTAAIYGVSRAAAAGAVAMRGLSASMAFFGGPIGLAITGVALAVWGLVSATGGAVAKNREMVASMAGASSALDQYEAAMTAAAGATGENRKAAEANAAAMRQEALNAVNAARGIRERTAALAKAAADSARRRADQLRNDSGYSAGKGVAAGLYEGAQAQADAAAAAAKAAAEGATQAEARFREIEKGLARRAPAVPSGSVAGAGRGSGGGQPRTTRPTTVPDLVYADVANGYDANGPVNVRQVDQNPALQNANDVTAAIEATRDRNREAFREMFSGGLLAALHDGSKGFEDWIQQGTERGLEKALDNLADVIFDLFSHAMPSGGGGGFWASAASAVAGAFGFGGARAYGGPVMAGRDYLVGEHGPEILRAPGNGMIIPTGGFTKGSGAAERPIVIKVEANDYFDARVDGRAKVVAGRISARASGAVYARATSDAARNAPGAVGIAQAQRG